MIFEDDKADCVWDQTDGAASPRVRDHFLRVNTTMKENKRPYVAAEAKALLQPHRPGACFLRSFVTCQVLEEGDERTE